VDGHAGTQLPKVRQERLPSSPRITVVVVTRNEGAQLRRTVDNLDATLNSNSNIVVVDDGSMDGSADYLPRRRGRVRLLRGNSLGVTRARNLGARATRGDVLVFADAHLELPSDWWRPLIELLKRSEVGAVAPVITDTAGTRFNGHGLTFRGPAMEVEWLKGSRTGEPVERPILPGCCLAMRRSVFLDAGGWDEGLLHRGNVDNELSIRLWLLGYKLLVTRDVAVGHLFRARSPYRTGWPEYLHNRLRLAFVHLNAERLARVVSALRDEFFFGEAMLLIAQGNSAVRRQHLFGRRVRDDDWFFSRFDLKW
jgi:GT2 family glycosyltransferase